LGHPTKELLEGEWVSSSYGFPPILIETPKVLKRKEVPLPEGAEETIEETQAFSYDSSIGLFSISISSVILKEPVEPPVEQTIEMLYQAFEAQGAKNIIRKSDVVKTTSGVEGVRIYGSAKFKAPNTNELLKGKYEILIFSGKGFQQTIGLSYLDNDTYAQQIADRIKKTLEVKLEL